MLKIRKETWHRLWDLEKKIFWYALSGWTRSLSWVIKLFNFDKNQEADGTFIMYNQIMNDEYVADRNFLRYYGKFSFGHFKINGIIICYYYYISWLIC